jgi:hypothetical protein
MTTRTHRHRCAAGAALLIVAAMLGACTTSAQWSTTYEQHYLANGSNWMFRKTYPAADRLFNAFDYGHAILYERLYTRPYDAPSTLEQNEYDFITKKLLVKPPRLPLEEAAIEVEYAKLVPEAKQMFEWAHVLHRQIYDVLADERESLEEKDARIARILAYYKTRPDLAFSSVPKTMDLMEGEYYALAFRKTYPKFNGLIWAYHWLQVGLYEPLVTANSLDARRAGVHATTRRFFQMLENAPQHMPRVMPMTAAVAPTFSRRYPEIAIIFDNLHGMHDVISDVLASPQVPRSRKREVILGVGERYRDSTSYVMSRQEWVEMADMMGIANMGGPAVGFTPEFPTPTVERGATMAEAMKAMGHDHDTKSRPATQGESAGTLDEKSATPSDATTPKAAPKTAPKAAPKAAPKTAPKSPAPGGHVHQH